MVVVVVVVVVVVGIGLYVSGLRPSRAERESRKAEAIVPHFGYKNRPKQALSAAASGNFWRFWNGGFSVAQGESTGSDHVWVSFMLGPFFGHIPRGDQLWEAFPCNQETWVAHSPFFEAKGTHAGLLGRKDALDFGGVPCLRQTT